MLDSNTWNYLNVSKQWQYLIVCKQITLTFLKNKITYKLFTYKSYSYIHLTVYKQMTDV